MSKKIQNQLILSVGRLDYQLSDLEYQFSAKIGEAGRWAKTLLIRITLAITVIGGSICLVLLLFVGRIISNIQAYGKSLSEQNRLKSGQTELNETMRGEQTVTGLTENIIRFLCDMLNAGIGAVYVMEEHSRLKLAGTYAFQPQGAHEIKLGDGLVGQAALEKRHILTADCPQDYFHIRSGMGSSAPRYILTYPLIHDEKVEGVLELGSFQAFSKSDFDFLKLAAESIAVAINSTQSRNRSAVLLKKTQQQAGALQKQQEELRATNEELEEQTTALKASEERLQTQQEELKVTNEELAEQAQLLEEQKEEITKKNADLEGAGQIIEEKMADLKLTSQFKSEFLANMSHELRTPLNSILLLAKLLSENKEKHLTAKQVEFSETIYSSGADLLKLINEVLDLSKVESGKLGLEINRVNIEQFTEKMRRTYETLAKEKGLELNIRVSSGLPLDFQTDSLRLEQIIKNLLSNAIKFTSKGSVTLSVTCPDNGVDLSQSGLDSDSAIAFSVIDTGIGIPSSKQKVIFEAFQQADGTTNRKYGGTGLGLSISRHLSTHLQGEVQIKSKEGHGSTFTLYLPPAVHDKDVRMDKKERPQSIKETSAPLSAGMIENFNTLDHESGQGVERIRDDRHKLSPAEKSILIIEDDPGFARILRDLAQEKAFNVLVAGDGETGLHFADYYHPSAIILDIRLPGIDGWNVMARLKDNPRTRHIPVHFISAGGGSSEAKKMGAVGFLSKPVSMNNINTAFGNIEKLILAKNKRLLVVDDDPHQRKSIFEILDGKDISITTVQSGQEALDRLHTDRFHCIVMDLTLPDMTGSELLEKIKSDERLAHIPVIVHTDKELHHNEKAAIDKHSERLIPKNRHSLNKLLDETALFLHRVEADLPEEKQQILKMVHDKASILKNKTVLLVDDDMRNVYAISNILEDKGVVVRVGKNGHEALSVLEKHQNIDLILMDIMMPEMNGYEAMGKIREKARYKTLPIIALTAKAMKGDRAKCIEAGANDYLAKPVDTEKLLSMLRVWLY
jgi:tubulin-specific chaperone A